MLFAVVDWDCDPPRYASYIAGIAGLGHRTQTFTFSPSHLVFLFIFASAHLLKNKVGQGSN
jgi:hypothetical protein